MITRFNTAAASARRLFARVLLALGIFAATNFDRIMDTLGYVEAELDSYVEEQRKRIERNDRLSIASLNREARIVNAERDVRVSLTEDSTDAATEMGRAKSIRARVNTLIGS